MGIYINGMDMPKKGCIKMLVLLCDGKVIETTPGCQQQPEEQNYKAITIPEHGRLIDADELNHLMYHQAFETDTNMQIWNSGCWIRYKMFEKTIETIPTVIPPNPT